MVVGFNHNFRYQGEVYHIQTEDSGINSPNIVTLLYQGGTILASKKTSYADIAKVDNLDQVVEELMKEQHKNMLRALKGGEFDAVIEQFKAGKKAASQASAEVSDSVPPVVAEKPFAPTTAVAKQSLPEAASSPETKPEPPPSPAQTTKQPPAPAIETSLDEVILSYLMGDE